MHSYTYTVSIAAPASKVWSFLGNFETYATWNPFITAVRADARPYASEMVVRMDQKWSPTEDCVDDKITLEMYDPTAMTWQMIYVKNFFGHASYNARVKPNGDMSTDVEMKVLMGGVMRIVGHFVKKNFDAGFPAMLEALKQVAEKS